MGSGVFENVKTAAIDGTDLAFREQGAGEPVVFVHGGLSDLRTWEQQLPAIGGSFRAITYSRRFARPNEDIDPAGDDQMLPHVEDLVALLRTVDAAPAHLVGNSWGAFICLLTAIRHPDVVRSLTLEEPPVLPLLVSAPPRPPELARLLVRRPATGLAIMRFGAGTIARVQKAFRQGRDQEAMDIFVSGVLGDEPYARLPEARKQQMRENVSALRAQMLGAGFPLLRDEDVRKVRVPVLLLTGERSPAVLRRLIDYLHGLLPDADRVEIPGASHVMHEENPEAVNEALLGFLGRQSSLRPPPPT